MKRAGHLFERILERENLRFAFYRARKGKRGRPDVEAFAANLEANLHGMALEVEAGSFPLGRYQQFTIHDPKLRTITAPCFSERVLHHAVTNVCEPYFERFLIDDSFACRSGKGRIAALQRALEFSGKYGFAIKLDMRKYFQSISHDILVEKLRCRFKDRRLLELFRRIINSHGSIQGRGLPIGSLTSQHFANFYLGWFDRFVKETLRTRGYVRYMDDCVLWSTSKAHLLDCVDQSCAFLRTELDLEPKTDACIAVVRHGLDFLGCRVYPDHLKLNRRSRRRFRRKLFDLAYAFDCDFLNELEYQQRLTALLAFTRAGGVKSWQFRRSVLQR
jgi:RNA-directed DNA polymerase